LEEVVSEDEKDEKLDLSAWEPQLPPSDFAERVLARVKPAPPARKPRAWGKIAAGTVGALAIAAAVAVGIGRAPSHGEAIAKERIEVSVGSRARAVLEPGAQVRWDGDDVTQPNGDVFYRVEPGARFIVHTPAGDVEVKGTCFTVKVVDMQKRDIKSGAVGAALSALAFVAVYEGKVAVSHAGQRADLAAGESAQIGADGLSKSATGEGSKEFDAKVAAAQADGDPTAAANQNLVTQVGEYRKRLEAIAQQKTDLEKKLATTEKQLEAAREAGTAPRSKHEFDLDADDWKELAKDGTIKARIPCLRDKTWMPSPESLQKLGLAPHDSSVLQNAYKKSNERLWNVIRPICAQSIGSVEVADKLGAGNCQHVVLDVENKKDSEAVGEAMRQVGEIRAGLRPMPGANEQVHPVVKMFLAVTGEGKLFENDLAEAWGPEEAHRIAFAEDGLCIGTSTWGGHGPREPKK
jgi:hypothetical protein